MTHPLTDLMNRYRKGRRSVFCPMPYLPLALLRERNLEFNRVLQEAGAMAEAATSMLDLGFEGTALPFDLNVEAEVLGAVVQYHEAIDGNPIYPTIRERPVQSADDLVVPDDLSEAGRIPVILEALNRAKKESQGRGAVGMFLTGPFTLAGQVMDVDRFFVMTLKNPAGAEAIIARLSEFLRRLRDLYVQAGAEFVTVEDGAATSVSPKVFRNLLLPHLKSLFAEKRGPMLLSLTGHTGKVLDLMLECEPDGMGIDQESDIAATRERLPEGMPLFAIYGQYTLLARGTGDEVAGVVREALDRGAHVVLPPPDVYPPAKIENLRVFVHAASAS